VSTVDHYKC